MVLTEDGLVESALTLHLERDSISLSSLHTMISKDCSILGCSMSFTRHREWLAFPLYALHFGLIYPWLVLVRKSEADCRRFNEPKNNIITETDAILYLNR
jgi:hypothetical protein